MNSEYLSMCKEAIFIILS